MVRRCSGLRRGAGEAGLDVVLEDRGDGGGGFHSGTRRFEDRAFFRFGRIIHARIDEHHEVWKTAGQPDDFRRADERFDQLLDLRSAGHGDGVIQGDFHGNRA